MDFIKFITEYNYCPFCNKELTTNILNFKSSPLKFKINENNGLEIYDTLNTNRHVFSHDSNSISEENKILEKELEINLNSNPYKIEFSKFTTRPNKIRVGKTCFNKCIGDRNFTIVSKNYTAKYGSKHLRSHNQAFYAIDYSFYDEYKILLKYYPNWKKCFIANSKDRTFKSNKFMYFNYCGKIDVNLYLRKIENYLII